jgi:type II secretory pathway pseudopilin PulG
MRMKSRRMNSPQPVAHSRTGFTMAETLVVLVLLAIVGGSLMNVLTKQQQFYNGTGDLIAMRTQLRQGEAILSGDLRGISSSGGDITTMTDSSIEFNYTIGTSVVCKAPAANTKTVIIPQTGALTNGNTLTSWIAKPAFGDQAYIFDEGAITTDATDDTWKLYSVTSLTLGTSTCDAAFNAPAGDPLVLTSTISATILDGAPVRFIRTAHYSLHQFADGLWYLGYCSPACGVGIAINPIAGPFRPYAPTTTPDTSGIRMTYYDSTGTVTNVPAQVSRIDITIRGQTAGYVHIEGMTKGVYHDSLSMSIALRNRS